MTIKRKREIDTSLPSKAMPTNFCSVVGPVRTASPPLKRHKACLTPLDDLFSSSSPNMLLSATNLDTPSHFQSPFILSPLEPKFNGVPITPLGKEGISLSPQRATDTPIEPTSHSSSDRPQNSSRAQNQITSDPCSLASSTFGCIDTGFHTQPADSNVPPLANLASEIVQLNHLYQLYFANPFVNHFVTNSPVCMLKRDTDDAVVLACNDAFAQLVGRRQGDCVNTRASSLLYQDFMQPFKNHFANSLAEQLRNLFLSKVNHGERRVKVGHQWLKETFVVDPGRIMYCKYDPEDEWTDCCTFNSSHSFQKTTAISKLSSDDEIAQAVCAKRMYTLIASM